MNRFGLVGLGMAALLISFESVAAAASPISFGMDLGVVSRDIEEEGMQISGGTVRGTADSTQLVARLGVEVVPSLILFGEVGSADMAIDEFDSYRSDMHLLYGGGARFVLAHSTYPQRFSVYSDVKVSRLKTNDQLLVPRCSSACDTTTATFVDDLSDEELSWTEYSVSLGVKGQYEGFRPFGGLRFSKLDGSDLVHSVANQGLFPDSRADVREVDSVGFFIGTDILLDPQERSAITIQLSGIDENVFRVGYKVAF
ncbi:MAG: hypothetical protein HY207_07960 [Nitrospirae bacterium]|nr:hypothetical protein [Nitrospirota bacterium]